MVVDQGVEERRCDKVRGRNDSCGTVTGVGISVVQSCGGHRDLVWEMPSFHTLRASKWLGRKITSV